jgi:hypothetical protein
MAKEVAEPLEMFPLRVDPAAALAVPKVMVMALAAPPETVPLIVPPSPPIVVSPAKVRLAVRVVAKRIAPRASELPVPDTVIPPAILLGVVLGYKVEPLSMIKEAPVVTPTAPHLSALEPELDN